MDFNQHIYNTTPRRLHYGCGDIKIPNYLNFDMRQTSATDLSGSLEDLLDGYSGCFDVIYLCHVLEHFGLHEIYSTLAKFKQLLREGAGQIYISVPNFEVLASMYLAGVVELQTIVRAIHGGQEYEGNTHYISFDRKLLSTALIGSGFTHVQEYKPSEFLPSGITDTSLYRIANRLVSLNIKARA